MSASIANKLLLSPPRPQPPPQAPTQTATQQQARAQQQPPPRRPEDTATQGGCDLTRLPVELDERMAALDDSVRATIITPGATWRKRSWAALLAEPTVADLSGEQQRQARQAAFDLLDALSRSGALPLAHTTLHVVLAATQAFDESLVDTVVRRNVNPVERAERGAVALACGVHGLGRHEAARLLRDDCCERVRGSSPMLFAPPAAIEDQRR